MVSISHLFIIVIAGNNYSDCITKRVLIANTLMIIPVKHCLVLLVYVYVNADYLSNRVFSGETSTVVPPFPTRIACY